MKQYLCSYKNLMVMQVKEFLFKYNGDSGDTSVMLEASVLLLGL